MVRRSAHRPAPEHGALLRGRAVFSWFKWSAVAGSLAAFGVIVILAAHAATVIGDINNDGTVSVYDLSLLLAKWGTADPAADLNVSGTVDVFDLSILLSHWPAAGGTTGGDPTPIPGAAVSINTPCGITAAPPAHYAHVIWIWMSNQTYPQMMFPGSFQQNLANRCASVSNLMSAGLTNKANAIAITSGFNLYFNDNNDPSVASLDTNNIFRLVRQSGGTAVSYVQSMGPNCNAASSGLYAAYRNPAVYYANASDHGACMTDNIDLGNDMAGSFFNALTSDATLPTFSLVIPDKCNSTITCPFANGDSFLAGWMQNIINSAPYKSGNTAVMIVYDQPASVGNIMVAPAVYHGKVSAVDYNIYSVLRTTEDMLGITDYMVADFTAKSMRNDFNF